MPQTSGFSYLCVYSVVSRSNPTSVRGLLRLDRSKSRRVKLLEDRGMYNLPESLHGLGEVGSERHCDLIEVYYY